ncbi:MAG TPA: aldo/keto reductase [Gaiellaceae bacterium]|nr:aldo/keto reductase [Gaiellaceae bacterium]
MCSVTVVRMRRLGQDGPEVSVVGLGTNNFGPRIDFEQTRAVIDAALEHGVTLFDTADVYGQGTSEEFIGRALEGRRDRVLIATKFGKPMDARPDESRGRPDYIRWAIEGSLRRLRTDHVDVFQMHDPDPTTPIDETLGTLHELVDEGKVRAIGSSNFTAEQIDEADRVARERGVTRFVTAQNHYSLVERDVEDDVLPACERLGIGVLPYFPLASGLLTGKYTRGKPATEGRLAGREVPEERWDRAEALRRYADERGLPLLTVAIGGLAAMPAVASVIAGATKPEQVAANVRAGEWEPTRDDLAALAKLR